MDDFEFLQRIGAGSYAVVWQARRKSDGKYVAIKELKEIGLSWDRVLRMPEVAAAKAFHHENCLKIHSVLRLRRRVFIVMEYADQNLFQVMNSLSSTGKRFTENQIAWIMKSILQGLAHIHEKGFMHRDLKPENIILFSTGSHGSGASSTYDDSLDSSSSVAKICDFGQAKKVHARGYSSIQGDILGKGDHTEYVSTRWYRAPEVLLQSTQYNESIDIWAAGVLMAELYTFRPIFAGTSESDQLYRIATGLGSPTDTTWPQGVLLARQNGIQLPVARSIGGIRSMVPMASPIAQDLLVQMLQWDPLQRPSARSLLQTHPFFRTIPVVPISVHNTLSQKVAVHQQASYNQKRADANEMQHLVAIDLEKDRRNAPLTPEHTLHSSSSPSLSLSPPPTVTSTSSEQIPALATIRSTVPKAIPPTNATSPVVMEDFSFDFGLGDDLQFGKLSLTTTVPSNPEKNTSTPIPPTSTRAMNTSPPLSQTSVRQDPSLSAKTSPPVSDRYPSQATGDPMFQNLEFEFEFDFDTGTSPYALQTSPTSHPYPSPNTHSITGHVTNKHNHHTLPTATHSSSAEPSTTTTKTSTKTASSALQPALPSASPTAPSLDLDFNLSLDSPQHLPSPPPPSESITPISLSGSPIVGPQSKNPALTGDPLTAFTVSPTSPSPSPSLATTTTHATFTAPPPMDIPYVSDDSEVEDENWDLNQSQYFDPELSERVYPSLSFSSKTPSRPPKVPAVPATCTSESQKRFSFPRQLVDSTTTENTYSPATSKVAKTDPNTATLYSEQDSSDDSDYVVSYVPNFTRK